MHVSLDAWIGWTPPAPPDGGAQRFCAAIFLSGSEGRKWGVRSVVVEFGVFGAPRFSVQKSPNLLKIGIWGPLD